MKQEKFAGIFFFLVSILNFELCDNIIYISKQSDKGPSKNYFSKKQDKKLIYFGCKTFRVPIFPAPSTKANKRKNIGSKVYF